MIYTVYFEIYGKKLKVEINAKNEQAAKDQVLRDIKFLKVAKKEDDTLNKIRDMFNMSQN